jgi:OmpA family
VTNAFNTILFILTFATSVLVAQQTVKQVVYFDNNQYHLTENTKRVLSTYCEKINHNQLLQITLTGYTDADGSNAYNLVLSEKRAKEILKYFVAKGINKDNINIYFSGEERPIAHNDNEQGKQQNRRVEIIVENADLLIGDIFKKLNKETQSFKSIGNEDIVVKGSEGTIIRIPKNALVENNGEVVHGDIDIELKEFYTKADMVSANLHTMSDKELLETAGMINISALYAGAKLKLKSGAKIEIQFACKSRMQNMQTFIGQEHNNQINWIPQNISVATVSIQNSSVKYRFGSELTDSTGYEGDTTATKELDKVDKMILTSGELGWINCDRFYKFENKTNLIVEIDASFKPVVRLVFKDLNAVMPGYYTTNKKMILNEIPVGQKATLIAFSLINNEPYFVSKDIVIGNNQNESMTLTKTTMKALMSDLQKLN